MHLPIDPRLYSLCADSSSAYSELNYSVMASFAVHVLSRLFSCSTVALSHFQVCKRRTPLYMFES